MTARRRGLALAALAAVLVGVVAGEPASGTRVGALDAMRGVLLDPVDFTGHVVEVGAPLSLPAAARAYAIEPARPDDLRALAERLAGGPVIEELPSRYATDLVSFATGDGWLSAPTYSLEGPTWDGEGWFWASTAWMSGSLPPTEEPCAAGRTTAMEQATAAFFERMGVPVRIDPPTDVCYGEVAVVELTVLVDGSPLVGAGATAMVDRSGQVIQAGGPLWRLTPLGDVELAPPAEVLRRLVDGPGVLSGDCWFDCTLTTDGAELGLARATTGGFGQHDHTPGGIVDEPPAQFLLPALRVPGGQVDPRATHLGVLAVSSAVLVDDPAQADAAREADAASSRSTTHGFPCGLTSSELAICTSTARPAAGVPVLLTAAGERYEPVGAGGCRPEFTVDPGDGSGAQSFLPRSGTMITARIAHTYAEPGSYTVTVRSVSRCSEPAGPGGGEPDFDRVVRRQIDVTD